MEWDAAQYSCPPTFSQGVCVRAESWPAPSDHACAAIFFFFNCVASQTKRDRAETRLKMHLRPATSPAWLAPYFCLALPVLRAWCLLHSESLQEELAVIVLLSFSVALGNWLRYSILDYYVRVQLISCSFRLEGGFIADLLAVGFVEFRRYYMSVVMNVLPRL